MGFEWFDSVDNPTGQLFWFATLAGDQVNVKSNLNEPEIKKLYQSTRLAVQLSIRCVQTIAAVPDSYDGVGVSGLENDHFIHYPTAILRGPNGNDTLSIGNVYSMAEDDQGFMA